MSQPNDIDSATLRLDLAAARVSDSTLSANLKANLQDRILVYAAFLTDLKEGRLPPQHDGVSEMFNAVAAFCLMIETELPATN